MFERYEDIIINLNEIQSVKASGNCVEVNFLGGNSVNIRTYKYDYIIDGPGRTTHAMYEEFEKHIIAWQKSVINDIYEKLKAKE